MGYNYGRKGCSVRRCSQPRGDDLIEKAFDALWKRKGLRRPLRSIHMPDLAGVKTSEAELTEVLLSDRLVGKNEDNADII